jgi:hypothetical protein
LKDDENDNDKENEKKKMKENMKMIRCFEKYFVRNVEGSWGLKLTDFHVFRHL